jgi:hypothetical protein
MLRTFQIIPKPCFELHRLRMADAVTNRARVGSSLRPSSGFTPSVPFTGVLVLKKPK